GIRDFHVTGVQTCALPILLLPASLVVIATSAWLTAKWTKAPRLKVSSGSGLRVTGSLIGRSWRYWRLAFSTVCLNWLLSSSVARSEERRVGKGCSSGGSPQ